MSASIINDNGKIVFSEDVIKQLVGGSATESYGVIGMAPASSADGFVELLKRDNISRGVKVDLKEDKVHIDLYIIVKYGISIKTVAENIIENVKYLIEETTGLTVVCVNVNVQAIRV